MDVADFLDRCPGELKPTTFVEVALVDGRLESKRVEGVGFVPHPLPPQISAAELLADIWPMVLAAERNLSLLEGRASLLPNPNLINSAFSRREAILSSKIENTHASAEELAVFDFDPSVVDNEPSVREVVNYIRALEHGRRSDLPICLRLIKQMHAILLEGVERKDVQPGEFRQSQNIIGSTRSLKGARFTPPPPEYLAQCLQDFERFANLTDSSWPRLVRFAMVHYQFEAIHPFLDGNGRLGRMLVTLMLCEQGQLSKPLVYVSGFFEQHRQEYYERLYRVSTRGEWAPWIEFFLTGVATQSEDAIGRANRLLELRDDFHARVRQKKASALLPELVDELFVNPAVSISSVQARFACGNQTASNLVKRLVEKGILREYTGRKRNRIFICPGILEVTSQ